MTRKRIADQEPAVSNDAAAAAAAKAPVKATSPTSKKARAPRASATAVTHRHKKNAVEPLEAPEAAGQSFAAAPVAAVPAPVAPPTREEIAVRAYLLAESRGFSGGSMDEDWLNAERQLSEERAAK